MCGPAIRSKNRPRELRRRAVVRARVRHGAQWGDACILNVSSRGLMIQTARPMPVGSTIEILRGDHLILAEVMWSAAGRSGVRSEERLPVEDILSVEQSHALRLVASNGVRQDWRRTARGPIADSRMRGRAFEFLAVSTIAVCLAVGVWAMASQGLSRPLERVSAALGG